jgi:hypothetical protein
LCEKVRTLHHPAKGKHRAQGEGKTTRHAPCAADGRAVRRTGRTV